MHQNKCQNAVKVLHCKPCDASLVSTQPYAYSHECSEWRICTHHHNHSSLLDMKRNAVGFLLLLTWNLFQWQSRFAAIAECKSENSSKFKFHLTIAFNIEIWVYFKEWASERQQQKGLKWTWTTTDDAGRIEFIGVRNI